MEQTETFRNHTVLLENRETLSVSGVQEVPVFDEANVIALTQYGRLEIRGEDLKITALDLDSGELSVTGGISSLSYSAAPKGKNGFFSRVFG